MSSKDLNNGKGNQTVNITAGGNVEKTTVAGGSITQSENAGGDVTGGDNIENEAQLLNDIAALLKDSGEEGEEAIGALNEELDKARKSEKPDQFKLAGVINQIVKLAPQAASKLIELFAPAIWGNLAKGAVKTAVDSVKAMV